MYKIRFLCLVLCLITSFLLSTTLSAQQEDIKFESVPAEQGLSNKSIPAIIEDKHGFLWFATQDGLNKYNGYEFTVYQNDPSDSTTISNNNIFCLIQDREGFLWLGTENGGLDRFDPNTEKSIRFMHDENNPSSLSSNNVYSVLETKRGELWVGTWEAGIDVMDKKTGKILKHFRHDASNENSLSEGGIWSLHEDAHGFIWVSTWGGGLDRFDPSSGNFTHFRHDKKDPASISNNIVGPVFEDSEGRIWISTWGGGLNKFDSKKGTFRSFQYNPEDSKSISSNRIWPIVEDWEGNLWIGTYGAGICRFDPRTEKFHRFSHDPENPNSINYNDIWALHLDRSNILWIGTEGAGVSKFVNISKEVDCFSVDPGNSLTLSQNSVRAVYEDENQIIWVGTWDGGLDKLDMDAEKSTNFKHPSSDGVSTGYDKIKSIYGDRNGSLWIGSYRGGLCEFNKSKGTFSPNYLHDKTDPNSISDNFVYAIQEDQRGNLWVGTLNGLNIFDRVSRKFFRFKNDASNDQSLSNNTINTIYVCRDGSLWIGTDRGLNKFNYDKKSFTRFYHDTQDPKSLVHSTIYTIFEDKAGTMWVGTRGGLNKFDPHTKIFEHYTVKDGLPSDIIMAIEEDNNEDLLISTKNGISRFLKKSGKFINYDLSDGIQGRQFFPNSSFKTKDGKMYFGGTEGLNAFYPDKIQNNNYIPPVLITRIRKFGEDIRPGKPFSELTEITLPYDQNTLSFDFVALSYANAEENQYAYHMEGLDSEWKYSGNVRFATFSNLRPGTYVFRVKASNDDGLWNEKGASIRIIINPPFWKTVWFFILCLLAGVLLVFAYIKNRERKLRKEKKVLERKVDERTAEVMMQKEIVETQNKEIRDSILYAKRIQEAILPTQEEIRAAFPDSFVLFKPRDIVSGDFYWFSEKNGKLIITVADCTGHGVPGAFMSMIGNTLLNEIVNEKEVLEPDKILYQLRENIMKCLKQTGAEGENKDGMDIALCVYDKQSMELQFAGANNPLYLITLGDLVEIKGDKQPIGVYKGDTKPFTSHPVKLTKGDCVYIASDGYADQFGGTNGKKFKYKQLKDLLLTVNNQSMAEQKKALDASIEQWKGGLDQVDDILVVGFRV
jgi:ligand-binding sensor domain-containing protein/serine phosphatase RsbU (regulator of sigma subunit)